MNAAENEVDAIYTPQKIREGAKKILQLAMNGNTHFSIDWGQLDTTAQLVVDTIKKNFPQLNIPYHSRWNHFNVGNIDRVKLLNKSLSSLSGREKMIAQLDLAIVSVLLDAGAGDIWQFFDKSTGQTLQRSEGLAVASLCMFEKGFFSRDPASPLRVDASRLCEIGFDELQTELQVDKNNPLNGIQGRLNILQKLGEILLTKDPFNIDGQVRPGHLFYCLETNENKIEAASILKAILENLGDIWPNRLIYRGFNLGDTWHYPPFGPEMRPSNFISFHKLSQWMTYSLLEVFESAGYLISNINELTALAEYRNGGLLIDSKLIALKNQKDLAKAWAPGDEIIIEWRALTICLIEKIADKVREILDLDRQSFPLAKVLEGGTWAAGRALAYARSPAGDPPLKIKSDGTVF